MFLYVCALDCEQSVGGRDRGGSSADYFCPVADLLYVFLIQQHGTTDHGPQRGFAPTANKRMDFYQP